MDAAATPQAVVARLDGPPRSFVLDGDVYELTRSWRPLLDHLGRDGWRLPLLLDLTHPEDAEVLRARLADRDDDLSVPDVERIAERLVLAATGQPYWVAGQLLLGAAADLMRIDGDLSQRGIDIVQLIDTAPARACNVIYAWMVEGADQKGRTKFNTRLFAPPRGAEPEAIAETWSVEQEGALFMQAMGSARASGAIKDP
jgi:hypothetical protein